MYTELYSNNGECVRVPYEIGIHQYPNPFIVVNCKCNEYIDRYGDEEDEFFKGNKFVATYYDPINKNTIYLEKYIYDGEKCDDITKVINATSNIPYDYLMKELRNNNGISVFWSQLYGTTSDYTIVYDRFGSDCLYDKYYVDELLNKHGGYKYNYIKYGRINKITNKMMGNKYGT